MGKLSVDLSGKVCLVTGSSRGIGRAMALAFAANGADVVVNHSKSADAADEVRAAAAGCGVKAIAVKCDVASEEDVAAMFEKIAEAFGKTPDILVNNAGAQIRQSSIEKMPLALWNQVVAINLTGAMLCCRAAIPQMKAQRWGRIINVTSISGRSGGGPGGSHYSASKAGLILFTRSLTKELAPFGITCNAIAPGVILTEMHEKFNTPEALEKLRTLVPLGYLGEPEDCAGAALFLASEDARYMTGAEIAINGGMRMN